jgi:hypothetical protein
VSVLRPTAAEAASLRFLVGTASLGTRFLTAGALFTVGLVLWGLAPGVLAPLGLVVALAGHLPLWVRRQTNAPGGATPAHEDVWAPVEDDWLKRVEALERRGEKWDTTPWDASNSLGCMALLGALAMVGGLGLVAGSVMGFDLLGYVLAGAGVLLVPLWLNGMRATWNPSELRKKGAALAVAREEAESVAGKDFEPVPLLALREGRRGRYPVDARLMLRPARDDGSGFLGVQVQVAMNNVQGKDYPYLYAVILGKGEFRLPEGPKRQTSVKGAVDLVCERGQGEGVRYLVVRQHADNSGGWHTEPDDIRAIVATALAKARPVWPGATRPAP